MCHGFSVIASVHDTSDQLAPGPLIRVCEMSLDAPFHISSYDTISSRVNFSGCIRLRRPKILPFWFEIFLASPGAFDQGVWGVYGFPFSWWFQWHHLRQDLSSHGGILILVTWFTFFHKEQTSVITTDVSMMSLTLAIHFSPVSLVLIKDNQKA